MTTTMAFVILQHVVCTWSGDDSRMTIKRRKTDAFFLALLISHFPLVLPYTLSVPSLSILYSLLCCLSLKCDGVALRAAMEMTTMFAAAWTLLCPLGRSYFTWWQPCPIVRRQIWKAWRRRSNRYRETNKRKLWYGMNLPVNPTGRGLHAGRKTRRFGGPGKVREAEAYHRNLQAVVAVINIASVSIHIRVRHMDGLSLPR